MLTTKERERQAIRAELVMGRVEEPMSEQSFFDLMKAFQIYDPEVVENALDLACIYGIVKIEF